MSFKRLVTFLLLTSVLLAGVAPVLAQGSFDLLPVIEAYMPAIPQGFGGTNVDTLVSELAENPPFLLDVREASELAENGYIEGAVNVPLRTVAQHLDLLPAELDAPIVVYCAKGTRGAIGMTALQVLGYTNVRNLSGGFGAWIDAGFEAVMGEPMAEPGTAAAIDPELVAAVDNYLTNVLPQGWGQVSADDVFLELAENPPFLLDVREDAELEADGYIEGSVHIALREVAANLDQIPADQPIVVYCKSGFRGGIATVVLQMLGYNARNMSGGIGAWINAGYDVVGGAGHAAEAFSLQSVIEAYMPAIPQGFGGVGVDSLASELAENPPFLVDVREVNELADNGFIEGAVNIPVRTLAQHLDLLPEELEPPSSSTAPRAPVARSAWSRSRSWATPTSATCPVGLGPGRKPATRSPPASRWPSLAPPPRSTPSWSPPSTTT